MTTIRRCTDAEAARRLKRHRKPTQDRPVELDTWASGTGPLAGIRVLSLVGRTARSRRTSRLNISRRWASDELLIISLPHPFVGLWSHAPSIRKAVAEATAWSRQGMVEA
jgi:hypothetical protein